jgi:hypothetical protein
MRSIPAEGRRSRPPRAMMESGEMRLCSRYRFADVHLANDYAHLRNGTFLRPLRVDNNLFWLVIVLA